ncbi:hypothetical protein KR018_006028 [Drosophila ironensis]|nr:hypothetical protein KR018_006028 [Drosophila ironensis]
MSAATHMALPAHAVVPPQGTPTEVSTSSAGELVCPNPNTSAKQIAAGKRGHKRSVSLENNAPLALRSTPQLGSPLLHFQTHGHGLGHGTGHGLQPFHTGTLKSSQEQRRLSQKFGSYSNLDDEAGTGGGSIVRGMPLRSKFQNIRQMFELSRNCAGSSSSAAAGGSAPAGEEEALQSLPATLPQRRTTPIAARSRHVQGEAEQANGNFLRPIAFKPIPFEPDYRIACQQQQQHQQQLQLQQQQQQQQLQQQLQQPNLTGGQSAGQVAGQTGERYGYGSTPSLAPLPVASATQKFGSTTDLRHLTARRRNPRILQRSGNEDALTLDLLGGGGGAGGHDRPDGASRLVCHTRHRATAIAKAYTLIADFDSKSSGTMVGSSDLTPSPSDSGISELEAALKDRDSELSYLRQAMEHNEKVILQVQKVSPQAALIPFQFLYSFRVSCGQDKEAYWEHENQRLRLFYEGQQREGQLKVRKMEQLLGLQQFQLKQHKLRYSEQLARMQQQLDHAHSTSQQLQQQTDSLRTQLEDSEWRVCERNGEIALLKTQLKEAHLEINMKDQAIVSLKHSSSSNANSNSHSNSNSNSSSKGRHNCDTTPSQSQPKKEEMHQQDQPDAQQLQKIISLKDQVIGALTNELAKLRKELSDLAIAHEYGEEPCGRYTRLKQQLDSLNEICQKTKKYTGPAAVAAAAAPPATTPAPPPAAAVQDLPKLDALVHRLQLGQDQQTLNTLIEESTTYAEDIAKLRRKLDDFRLNLELEKRQWSAEKDKVLGYQKQLQAHYIQMYQKLRCLDSQGSAIAVPAPKAAGSPGEN